MRQLDVAELGSTGAVLRRALDRGRSPDMRLTFGGCGEYLDGLGPPEAFLVCVGEAHAHALTRKCVIDEDHAALVAGDENSSVSYVGDVEFELGSDDTGFASSFIVTGLIVIARTHLSSIPYCLGTCITGPRRKPCTCTSPPRLLHV